MRLLVPREQNLENALALVRQLLPQASIDYNHSYELGQSALAPEHAGDQALAGGRYHAVQSASARLGIIDSGIALEHETLAGATIEQRSFLSNSQQRNLDHGTAVASLLVGNSPALQGMATNASLVAAEAFFEEGELGLISTSYQLVQAMDWLSGEDVLAINMSLAGPANQVLERAVSLVIERNILVVAAAGNDGPTSAPRFPAAYPGVIAVTAIDRGDRAYLRAVRGDHLDFAAPGVELSVADAQGPALYRSRSGTSFAAPFVTALVVHYRQRHPEASAAELIEWMQADVIDLGAPGRDPVFGWGLAGASLLTKSKEPADD